MEEDWIWGVSERNDMCEGWSAELKRGLAETEYYDELARG